MKLLMSDYEVTLVNDNMQVSLSWYLWEERRGEEGEGREGGEGGDKRDEQVSEVELRLGVEISSRADFSPQDLEVNRRGRVEKLPSLLAEIHRQSTRVSID